MAAPKIKLTALIVAWIVVALIEYGVSQANTSGLLPYGPAILIARGLQISALLIVVKLFHNSLSAVGLAAGTHRAGILGGLYWSIVFGGTVAVVATAILAGGYNPLTFFYLPTADFSNKMILLYLTGGLVAPVAEEILFRGVVYGFFRRWGIIVGVTISTSIFALFHIESGMLPITQTIGGIVFCLAYEKEKSLLAPMTIHITGNLALFTLGIL